MHLTALVTGMTLAAAAGATQTDPLNDDSLQERAATEACYMKLIRLYRARYLASQDHSTACVELTYRRPFSIDELSRSTRLIYRHRHGEQQEAADQALLDQVTANYQPVAAGDAYQYCKTDQGGGWLYHNRTPVLHIEDPAAAGRIMGIWVVDVDANGRPDWNFSSCFGKVF